MSPLLVMDDICTEWAGLAVSPWCSSKNESSLVSFKKYQGKKVHHKKERRKIKTFKGLYSLLPL